MKKRIFLILSILFVCTATALLIPKNKEEELNFFKYMIELNNSHYTFGLKKLDYGLSIKDVTNLKKLSQENVFSENTTLIKEEAYEEVALGDTGETIESLQYKEAYYFDDEFGLYGATYTVQMDPKYEESIRTLLHEQAIGYMPKPNHYGGFEQIKSGSLLEWDELRDDSYLDTGKDIIGETCVTLKIWVNKEGLLEILMSCRISSQSSLWE